MFFTRLRRGVALPSPLKDPISLLQVDAAEAAAEAVQVYGKFSAENATQWKQFAAALLTADWVALKTTVQIVDHLTEARFAQASFWKQASEKINEKIGERFGASLKDLVSLTRSLYRIRHVDKNVHAALCKFGVNDDEAWVIDTTEFVDYCKTLGMVASLGKEEVTSEVTKILAMRLAEETRDFNLPDLLVILRSFADMRISPPLMMRKAAKVINDQLWKLEASEIAEVADIYRCCKYRNDTFFKTVVKEIIADAEVKYGSKADDVNSVNASVRSFSLGEVATIAQAVKVLGLTSDDTEWWAKKGDYASLLQLVLKVAKMPGEIEKLPGWQLPHCAGALHAAGANQKQLYSSLNNRLHFLMRRTEGQGHRYLADTLEHMSRIKVAHSAKRSEISWLQEWLCEHVYEFELSQVARINRYLIYNDINDHNYVKIWVDYYLQRMHQATKEDVRNIKDTFNKVKLYDNKIGRDLFYALGKRYQALCVTATEKNIVRLG